LLGAPPESPGVARAFLVVYGPGAVHVYDVPRDQDVVTGRDPDLEIRLDDGHASRRHALFRFDGETFTIRDLGSRNGTRVNGRAISATTPLAPGDEIAIGAVRFVAGIAPSVTPSAEGLPRGRLEAILSASARTDRQIGLFGSEKLASIGLLAAGVAQEIIAPTTTVLANLHSLERTMAVAGADDGDVRAILAQSRDAMRRIATLARSLRSFSELEGDAESDAGAALDAAVTLLGSELRGVEIERRFGAGRFVRLGPARLAQVCLNLVLNASQALAERAAAEDRIVLSTRDDGDMVEIEVADTGPGIPPSVLPRVFDSFFTTRPAGSGAGLGLPIARAIVRLAGGDLVAESLPGEGARFRVRLPAGSPPAARRSSIPAPALPARYRVLLVEDDEFVLESLRRVLAMDHEVVAATGGREALSVLERDAGFDVIVTDIQMLRLSGMQLHAEVKSRWPALGARFVFVTGGAYDRKAKAFIDSSPGPVLMKPFDLEDLKKVLVVVASRPR
jgi:signal transduction histidine kinase/CheY-like chemotaxis protein